MADERKRVARRLLLLPVIAWALMAAGGFVLTRALAGEDGLQAMWLAQSLVLMIVLATLLLAMRRMIGRSAIDRFKLAMLAGGARFLGTAALLAVVAWRGNVDVFVFLMWGAGTYLVMAIVEAVALARWFRFLESETRC